MRNWPKWTIAFLIALPIAFALQIILAPAACTGAELPAFCSALALLEADSLLGLLLMPFLHGTIRQFFLNILLFAGFGGLIELRYSRKMLLWLFVLGGYLSTAVQVQTKLMQDAAPIAVGSSGGVAALMGFFVVMQVPRSKDAVRKLLDSTTDPKTILRPILLLIGTVLVAEIPFQHFGLVPVDPRTSTLSHLVGAIFGIGTALVYRRV